MKRVLYNISCRGENKTEVLKTVQGYTFEIDGVRFGVSNTSPEGARLLGWKVTELNSGYIAEQAPTKNAAMDKVLNKAFIEKIKKYMPDHEDVNKDVEIQESYIWSEE